MGWLIVDTAREDESTGGTTVLTEEREVTTHNILGTLLIVLNARSLGIVVIGGSGDTAPILGIDIAVGLTLAEPISVPVTDGYLVLMVVGLPCAECSKCRHHTLCCLEIFLFFCR